MEETKSKTPTIIVVAVIAIVLIVAGIIWSRKSSSGPSDIQYAFPEENVLENKPDINPVSAGNPIKNIKTNPFD